MKKRDVAKKMTFTQGELVREHKKLTKALRAYKPLKEEYEEQSKELKAYSHGRKS